ncbi:hypothetical protein GCM10009599_13190 [Luteococcus peritonei]
MPWLDHARGPGHRWVRLVSWLGVALLLAWGGLGMVGAWIGLARGADATPALVGHALLWDPLFVLWGLLLAGALHASRSRPGQRGAAGRADRAG